MAISAHCGRILERIVTVGKWFPVALVCFLLAYSYYAYFIVIVLQAMQHAGSKALCAILYHALLFLVVSSYYRSCMTPPVGPPLEYQIPLHRLRLNDAGLPVASADPSISLPTCETTLSDGSYRYCFKCQLIKPDRTHHCGTCDRCVLKYDHHCPWINNCASWSNYKYFVLFLFHGSIFTTLLFATVAPIFVDYWSKSTNEYSESVALHIVIGFVLSLIFALPVWALFLFHAFLLANNRTTLESSQLPHFREKTRYANGFYLGVVENIKQVLGDQPSLWLLPVPTSAGNGASFPVVKEYEADTVRPLHSRSVVDLPDVVMFGLGERDSGGRASSPLSNRSASSSSGHTSRVNRGIIGRVGDRLRGAGPPNKTRAQEESTLLADDGLANSADSDDEANGAV